MAYNQMIITFFKFTIQTIGLNSGHRLIGFDCEQQLINVTIRIGTIEVGDCDIIPELNVTKQSTYNSYYS